MGFDLDFGAIGGAVGAVVGGTAGFLVGGPAGAIAGAKIGAGVGAVGGSGLTGDTIQDFATMGASAQERAEMFANRARQEQAKLQKERNRRQYIQQIRAARIQRARVSNVSLAEPGISSGRLGALSSIGSQVASNINFMQTSTDYLNKIQSYENLYNKHTNKANTSYKLMSTATSLLSNAASTFYTGPTNTPSFDIFAGSQAGTTATGLPIYDVTGTAATGGNVRIY